MTPPLSLSLSLHRLYLSFLPFLAPKHALPALSLLFCSLSSLPILSSLTSLPPSPLPPRPTPARAAGAAEASGQAVVQHPGARPPLPGQGARREGGGWGGVGFFRAGICIYIYRSFGRQVFSTLRLVFPSLTLSPFSISIFPLSISIFFVLSNSLLLFLTLSPLPVSLVSSILARQSILANPHSLQPSVSSSASLQRAHELHPLALPPSHPPSLPPSHPAIPPFRRPPLNSCLLLSSSLSPSPSLSLSLALALSLPLSFSPSHRPPRPRPSTPPRRPPARPSARWARQHGAHWRGGGGAWFATLQEYMYAQGGNAEGFYVRVNLSLSRSLYLSISFSLFSFLSFLFSLRCSLFSRACEHPHRPPPPRARRCGTPSLSPLSALAALLSVAAPAPHLSAFVRARIRLTSLRIPPPPPPPPPRRADPGRD